MHAVPAEGSECLPAHCCTCVIFRTGLRMSFYGSESRRSCICGGGGNAFTFVVLVLGVQRVQSVLQGFLAGVQQHGAALRARWVAGGGAPAAPELAVGHACGAPALIGDTAPNVWRGSLPPELAVTVRAAASPGEVNAGSKHPAAGSQLLTLTH